MKSDFAHISAVPARHGGDMVLFNLFIFLNLQPKEINLWRIPLQFHAD